MASFGTIFPGHYDDRAIHTHLLTHSKVTVLVNNTIVGGTVSYLGRLFWNTELRAAVEATYPYSTNTQSITSNEDDIWAPVQADNDYDPFPEYLYLGSDITEGLLAWIQIGINTTLDMTDNSCYSVAAKLDADGGYCVDGCSAGCGSGSGGGEGVGNGIAGRSVTAPGM